MPHVDKSTFIYSLTTLLLKLRKKPLPTLLFGPTLLFLFKKISHLHSYLNLHLYLFSRKFPTYTIILVYSCIRNSREQSFLKILTFSHDSNAKPIAIQIEIVGKTEHHNSTISIANFPGNCSSHTYFEIILFC